MVFISLIKPLFTLRHSYVTLKCVEGKHLIELAEYMGHTTTKTR